MKNYTKNLLAETLKDLMEKQTLAQIRVSDICKICEIERSTFYYHFKDKYELAAWIFLQTAKGVDISNPEQSASSLDKIRNDILFYRQALADSSQNALWKFLHEYFTKEYINIIEKKTSTPASEDLKFQIRFYCYGCVYMTKEWIYSDPYPSSQTVVKTIYKTMPTDMAEIIFNKSNI